MKATTNTQAISDLFEAWTKVNNLGLTSLAAKIMDEIRQLNEAA